VFNLGLGLGSFLCFITNLLFSDFAFISNLGDTLIFHLGFGLSLIFIAFVAVKPHKGSTNALLLLLSILILLFILSIIRSDTHIL